MTASDARPPSDGCECPPCPGRGNDGHGLTHCAECCFGTGVEADIDCPVHGDARPPSDTGTTGWHTHGGECVWPDGRCYVCDAVAWTDPPPDNPSARPVLVVDPAEARETIARAAEKRIRDWLASTSETYAGDVGSDAWVKGLAGYITQGPGSVLAALAGQGQP